MTKQEAIAKTAEILGIPYTVDTRLLDYIKEVNAAGPTEAYRSIYTPNTYVHIYPNRVFFYHPTWTEECEIKG